MPRAANKTSSHATRLRAASLSFGWDHTETAAVMGSTSTPKPRASKRPTHWRPPAANPATMPSSSECTDMKLAPCSFGTNFSFCAGLVVWLTTPPG